MLEGSRKEGRDKKSSRSGEEGADGKGEGKNMQVEELGISDTRDAFRVMSYYQVLPAASLCWAAAVAEQFLMPARQNLKAGWNWQ